MRNPLNPAPVPNSQEYLWAFIGFVVSLSLLAGIAAVADRGADNWREARIEGLPT